MLKCASAEEKGGGKERRAHRDAEEAHLCSKGRRSHVAVGKGCRKLSDEEVYRALGKNVANCRCVAKIFVYKAFRLLHAKIGSRGTGARGGHRGLEAGVGGW